MPIESAITFRATPRVAIAGAVAIHSKTTLVTIIMQVTLAELESTFRQVPITGQHISSHPPPADLQHLG